MAEVHLLSLRQDGRPLEWYVEEFIDSWSSATLNACFQMGLDDEVLRFPFKSYNRCCADQRIGNVFNVTSCEYLCNTSMKLTQNFYSLGR
ncbi:hypothetical protein PO909_002417 [Leuciscus waleckii]